MANSHDGRIDELHGALAAALARGDDEEVRNLLSQIGRAELRAKAPKKRIQPPPADGDGPAERIGYPALEARTSTRRNTSIGSKGLLTKTAAAWPRGAA